MSSSNPHVSEPETVLSTVLGTVLGTVLIIGGSRGIGLELVKQCLANGNVVLTTYRQLGDSHELTQLAENPRLTLFQLDLLSPTSLASFLRNIADRRVDVLINNAGVFPREDVSSIAEYDVWLNTFMVNTVSPFYLVKTITETNMRQPTGGGPARVVVLSSWMASFGEPQGGHYAYRASKAALNKLVHGFSNELDREDIIICAVHPGWVKTDMGGANAEVPVAESVRGILHLVSNLVPENSGTFFNWLGEELPW